MKSVLIALVASAAVATGAAAARKAPPAAAPPSPPITKDGVEISILPRIAVGAAPNVTEVGLDLEARTSDAAARLGFQSLRAVADIDCGKSSNRFISAVAYQRPALAGQGEPRNITGEWVQPASDSYMAAVIARVCAAQAAAPSEHAPPVVKEMAAAPPPAAPQPAPQPIPAATATPAAPAATPPEVVKFSGSAVAATRTEAAAPPPTAPPPSPPEVVRFSGGRPDTTSPSIPSFLPKVAGDRIAQVAASADQHDAERVLRELRPLIAPPLTTSIEQAVVGGAHVYRADVIGFASAADAKAFCKSAAHVSKSCWVRARTDTPAKAAKPPEHLRPARRAG